MYIYHNPRGYKNKYFATNIVISKKLGYVDIKQIGILCPLVCVIMISGLVH